jgi:DNA-binding MarR family transcriptional regulator
MSVETPGDGPTDDVTGVERAQYPKPRAHGAGLQNVLNDLSPSDRHAPAGNRGTLYARAIEYWRENVGDTAKEPFVAVENFNAEWLPDGRQFALLLTSSRWKAGTGRGDDYSAYYDQHIKLREVRENAEGEREYRKPALALHVELMPQYKDLVYKSGDPLECPYGEGTRIVTSTTWAQSPDEMENRAYDALAAIYGADAFDREDVNPDSRRIQKGEAHIRSHIDTKNALVETIEQSKDLIDFGGDSEIDAYQKRVQEGWLEARVESGRWHMLGFERADYDIELKVYQRSEWHKVPETDPGHHPKLEASFSGSHGQLPHADEWDSVIDQLRRVVATHAQWAGVDRSDLIADDYFDGPACEPFDFDRPTGRRDMLYQRYKDRSTEIYREALKESTTAVYDVLQVVARENGATYDMLEEKTGLARSTVRYHVSRLCESGVFARRGNPVLVSFVSRNLAQRARDVLREVYPDDTPDQMEKRAEERRERRENDENGPAPSDDGSDDDSSDDAGSFVYLKDWGGTPQMLVDQIVAGERTETDVRVREFENDGPPR